MPSRIRLYPQDVTSPTAAPAGTLDLAADETGPEPGWIDDAGVFHTFVGATGATGPEGPEGPPGEGVAPTVVAHGAMGAAETFDYGDGPAHSAEADAACTWTFTGATAGEVIMTVYLEVDSGGPYAITLPASVANKTEAEAVLAAVAASTSIIIPFVTIDSGTTWTAILDEGGTTPDLDAVLAASTGQDIADALSGAAAPDSGNVFATMADVGGGGSSLLAVHQYAAADNLWTRTTASLADVDATNAAVTFTAPASGNVIIKAHFLVGAPTANRVGQVGLRVGSSDVAGPYQIAYGAASAMYSMVEPTFYVTGLTPSNSYTYKLAFMGDGVAACQIFYGPVTGGSNPPFVMTVWSAP